MGDGLITFFHLCIYALFSFIVYVCSPKKLAGKRENGLLRYKSLEHFKKLYKFVKPCKLPKSIDAPYRSLKLN